MDSFRIWDYANYEHSKYDVTTLFDLFDTYWDHSLRDLWANFPFHVQTNDQTDQFPFANLQLFLPDLLIMDRLAKKQLEEALAPYGEFLPVYSNDQELFFYHLLNKVPALDLEQSVFRRYPSSGRIADVRKYVFRKEIVENQVIFEIQDALAELFVTDRFVQLIENHQLKGVDYEPFWQG